MDKKELSLPKLDWRLLLVLGVAFSGIGVGAFVYGWKLKMNGESFSQYWIAALVSLWGGLVQVQRGLQKKSSLEKKLS